MNGCKAFGIWHGDVQGPKEGETFLLEGAHGQMGGFARGYDKNGLMFNEIITIMESEGSIEFRLKHFSPELHGWEPQNKPIRRPLIKITEDALYFDTVTYVKQDKDNYILYIRIPNKEGVMQVVAIPHKRITL